MERSSFPVPHDWREGRRLRAWELAQQGWPQRTIAAALGVTEGAVSQWLKRARAGGRVALQRRTSPGAPPKLSAAQRAQVPGLLARGATAYGFRGDVWTCPRVAAVIETHFGVRYHPAHVSRLVRALGWTAQRPIQRATQRDEVAIARWYAKRWPALKKSSYSVVKARRRAGGQEIGEGDRLVAVGTEAARTDPAAEDVALRAAPRAEEACAAPRALIDRNEAWRRLGHGGNEVE